MERIIWKSKRYIKMLQLNPCEYCRRIILFKLSRNITELGNICSVMNEERSAGRDLSGAFSSCHVAPSILEKLVVVGKLL